MPRRYWSLSAALLLLASTVALSCSGEKSTSSNTCEPQEINDSVLSWVGTDVVYGPVPCKHDLSIIFVMTEWCGWCKRLKRETLTDSTVIRILNESYNCVHLNPDADSMVVYRDSTASCQDMVSSLYRMPGYPTLLFFDRDGDLILTEPGYKPPEKMAVLLDSVRGAK